MSPRPPTDYGAARERRRRAKGSAPRASIHHAPPSPEPAVRHPHEEGAAPQVRLAATHQATLAVVPLDILRQYATD